MAREVGHARVSKREQNPEAQEAGLYAPGGECVFVDHGESSRVIDRPQWLACLGYLRPGIPSKFDTSIGSPVADASSQAPDRHDHPRGRALYGIVAAFAQLRVDTIRDNTPRGLDYARSQGPRRRPPERDDP